MFNDGGDFDRNGTRRMIAGTLREAWNAENRIREISRGLSRLALLQNQSEITRKESKDGARARALAQSELLPFIERALFLS